MGRGYEVIFGPVRIPGTLGSREVIGFKGPGEPGVRRRLTWDERRLKRTVAKIRRRMKRKR